MRSSHNYLHFPPPWCVLYDCSSPSARKSVSKTTWHAFILELCLEVSSHAHSCNVEVGSTVQTETDRDRQKNEQTETRARCDR